MWMSVIMVYVMSVIFVVTGCTMTAILPSLAAIAYGSIGVMGVFVAGSLRQIAQRVAALEKRVTPPG